MKKAVKATRVVRKRFKLTDAEFEGYNAWRDTLRLPALTRVKAEQDIGSKGEEMRGMLMEKIRGLVQ